jgi:protein involved in polysaccharide export with SLBB domain
MVRPFKETLSALATVGLSLGSAALMVAQTAPATPVDNAPAEPVVTISKPAGDAGTAPQSFSTIPSGSIPQVGFGAANGDYILRPGDTIEMIVYREQDLSLRSKIGKDGMVQLPLLGEVKIGGLSVRAATSLIRQKYNADYLVEPQIYLNISAYNSRKFTIIGQVGKPGAYEFGGGEEIGLLEAIGMAGGFTRIADRGHVVVKRREGDSIRTYKVNAKKLSDSGVDKFQIENGDVINVGESWY